MVTKKRDVSYELIRVLAMFFIVFDHALNSYLAPDVTKFIEPFVAVGVTLFFMLSGKFAFRLNLEDKSLYKKYYWKKIVGLIIPMLVYMAIKNWHIMVYNQHLEVTLGSYVRHFGTAFVNGFSYMEYWFLYLLIPLLIAVPFTARMMQNMKLRDKKAFLIVSLVLSTITMIVPNVLKMDFAMDYYFIGYIFYFYFGYIIEDIFEKESAKKKVYIAGLIGFIATIALVVLERKTGYKSFSPFYVFFTSAMFLGVREIGKKIPKKLEKLVTFIGKHSLGVYMIHIMFFYIIRDLHFFPENAFGYIGCALATATASIVASFILDSTVIKLLQKPCEKFIDE